MIIILKKNADAGQVENLKSLLRSRGIEPHESVGSSETVIGCVGDVTHVDPGILEALDVVEQVQRVQEPYKAANRKFHPEDSAIDCSGVKIGAGGFAVIAGPCSVESEEQVVGIAKAVKAAARQPLIVKLTPNVSDITENALAAEEAGADAISMINTLTGIAVDVNKRKMVLANNTGGLSGPAVRPVALRMVWQSAKKVHIPIIGMGGIETGEDAAAFMLCGAKAVMVGTANFTDPFACPRIIRELDAYCDRQKVQRAQELVGTLAEY